MALIEAPPPRVGLQDPEQPHGCHGGQKLMANTAVPELGQNVQGAQLLSACCRKPNNAPALVSRDDTTAERPVPPLRELKGKWPVAKDMRVGDPRRCGVHVGQYCCFVRSTGSKHHPTSVAPAIRTGSSLTICLLMASAGIDAYTAEFSWIFDQICSSLEGLSDRQPAMRPGATGNSPYTIANHVIGTTRVYALGFGCGSQVSRDRHGEFKSPPTSVDEVTTRLRQFTRELTVALAGLPPL